MHGVKFVIFALMLTLAAPVVVAAQIPGDTCSVPLHTSWMDSLVVSQVFDSPTDYRWQGSWEPRLDPDWQRHYCRDYDRACGAPTQCCR